MSALILLAALYYAQIVLAIAICLAAIRLMKGHRAQDRVLALDTAYLSAMLSLLVTAMIMETSFFFEAAMVMAVVGFVSSIALAKFLLRGEVIE